MVRPNIGSLSWGDALNADLNGIEALARSAVDRGAVTGTVTLDSGVVLHEMSAASAITLVPSGAAGTVQAVRVLGTGVISLASGVTWDTIPLASAPGRIVFTRWPSGWVASAAGTADPIEVSPAAVTFNDTGNVTTVPGTTGVQYKRAGVNVGAGTITGEPAGLVTYTAVAKTGYIMAAGATTTWSHTYPTPPGWSVYDSIAYTAADGTLLTSLTTVGGRSPTGTGAKISSNRLKVGDQGNGTVDSYVSGMSLGTHWRSSIDFDVSDVSQGYEPMVSLYGGTQNGGFNFRIQNSNNGEYRVIVTTQQDTGLGPVVTYQGTWVAATTPIGALPKTGTMMMEIDTAAKFIKCYINGSYAVKIDWATSGWVLVGNPQTPSNTTLGAGITSSYAAMDNFKVEIYS